MGRDLLCVVDPDDLLLRLRSQAHSPCMTCSIGDRGADPFQFRLVALAKPRFLQLDR